ncbi:MoaD/ThiS family protein [Olivibacter sp. SDN3]|uniref:MoaD/ThiS family protein n=1 Tax=Olivibacter sp. SDN3 TaxID=2764720 RepID=UPI001651A176|nr:MoaD/ThiS family protein [Olivibacter sp. SDN3]QNL50158.1 MoaD/ThiS family protein [Olivibacter sp. SDN3]
MGISVFFFGQLTDITGCAIMQLKDEVQDTDQLDNLLKERYPLLQQSKYVITVDRTIIRENRRLTPDTEIALLPPFSGG